MLPDMNFWSSLTKRERQVLPLVVQGLPNKEIAQRLDAAEGTIRVHVNNLMKRGKCHSRTALAARALGVTIEWPEVPPANPKHDRITKARRLGLITAEQAEMLVQAADAA